MTNTNHQVIGAMKIELSGKEVASMQESALQEEASIGKPTPPRGAASPQEHAGSMQGADPSQGAAPPPPFPRKDRIFFGKVCKLHWSVQGIIIIILPEHLFNVISDGTHVT